MATIKSFTSLEQSRKLAEILPVESADMDICNYVGKSGKVDGTNIHYYPKGESFGAPEIINAWSLAALLGVLPSSIKDSIGMVYSLNMNKEYIEYSNPNISSLYSAYIHTCGNNNLVDACYEMILKLHELKML